MLQITKYLNILVYLCISIWIFPSKPVYVTDHAWRRAKQRNIQCPDQVYRIIRKGKVSRFGKRGIKFTMRTKKRTLICLGEKLSDGILIKTVEEK